MSIKEIGGRKIAERYLTTSVKEDNLGLLQINSGITRKQILQLMDFAKTDDLVRKFTHDPGRFENEGKLMEWSSKRYILSLTDGEGDLQGIIWYGKRLLEKEDVKFSEDFDASKYGVTFAIRIYNLARGQGLAGKFMEAAHQFYTTSAEYREIKEKGIWLGTHNENEVALKSYLSFGYEVVGKNDSETFMVLPQK